MFIYSEFTCEPQGSKGCIAGELAESLQHKLLLLSSHHGKALGHKRNGITLVFPLPPNVMSYTSITPSRYTGSLFLMTADAAELHSHALMFSYLNVERFS